MLLQLATALFDLQRNNVGLQVAAMRCFTFNGQREETYLHVSAYLIESLEPLLHIQSRIYAHEDSTQCCNLGNR